MKDDLMADFIREQTDTSFPRLRWFCIDHAERHGSYAEFVGRLRRMQQALARRRTG